MADEQTDLDHKTDGILKLTDKQRKYIGVLRNKVGNEKYQKIKVGILGGFTYNSIEDGNRVIGALKKETGEDSDITNQGNTISKEIPKTKYSNKKQSLDSRAIEIKGKKYIKIVDRIEYFNKKYPKGRINTFVIENSKFIIIKAVVYPDLDNKKRKFTGHAGVDLTKTAKTEPIEDCETSAIGRALVLLGIGIYGSKSSSENIF